MKNSLTIILTLIATAAQGDGRTLYLDNCAVCHGENLEGALDWRQQNSDGTFPAPPHDSTGHTWHHADDMLFEYTKIGGAEKLRKMGVNSVVSGMPAFAELLTDDEIWSVLEFIKSTWPERIVAHQKQITEDDQ